VSLAGKRQEFADALSTVDDVTGYAYRPADPRAGDAWPVWGGSDRDDDRLPFTTSWRVVIQLPQEERASDEWIDAHEQDLFDAISPVAFIDGFAPANLGGQNSTVYGLVITTRSE